MKKNYSSPSLELERLEMSNDVLSGSGLSVFGDLNDYDTLITDLF